MKIRVVNTSVGFRFAEVEDAELAAKLKPGAIYVADIKEERNPRFHRKYWGLIKAAWEMQGERVQAYFGNDMDCFRKTIQIAAGFCNKVYSISRKEWQEEARSISFDHMDELEFEDLFGKVKGVIMTYFCNGNDAEEKQNYINNF